MTKQIMSGDEAIARGAYEAGVTIAAAYPGTPSTEILENLANYKEVYSQWACNEKVAFEIAAGASIGGARALAAFKHVGMNVAADPIFTLGMTGVYGGLVFVSADDPGCHSSQNEQDNRLYAQHAKLAMVEPSDSQECKDYTVAAYELSEKFDIPVMVRMTTRVCHSKSGVEMGERDKIGVRTYESNPAKYSMLPANARARHIIREKLLLEMEDYAYCCPLNRAEHGGDGIGVVTSGISYMHAKEVFGDSVAYLKLGLTYPLSRKLIKEFCEKYKTIYIIEEGEPYLETAVRALGFDCVGKSATGLLGELDAQKVREAFGLGTKPETYSTAAVAPGRPPVLCAGCPHRGFFVAMGRVKKQTVVVGDIGCYSLGINAPFHGFDVSICMGAGFSAAIGLAKALELQGDKRKVFGLVGDSTFFHSGMTGLVDIIHAKANVCAVIMDNSITAMTGHQENPGTALSLMGDDVPQVDLVSIVRATGIDPERVAIVDPIDLEAVQAAAQKAIDTVGPFVLVTKRPCALIKSVARANSGKHCQVDQDKCIGCKMCMKVACPALAFKDKKAYVADVDSCTACGLCAQMCKQNAITKVGE